MRSQKLNSKVKNFNTFKVLLVLLTFAFCLLTFASITNAQQVSLVISPPLVELVIKPGKSVLIGYKLENRGDPVILKSVVLPFQASDNLGNIKIDKEFNGPIRFNLDNSQLRLNQPFFLKSNDAVQLLLRIRVPEGAPEGDYYYTLLSETQPPPVKEGLSSGRSKASIGANILITVTQAGNLQLKGEIALFDVLSKLKLRIFKQPVNIFESTDKIPVVLIVNNKGGNLIKPQGKITLVGNFGEKAGYEIIPQNILSESQRQLAASPSAFLASDRPVSLVLSGFFLGFYKLSTTVDFGPGTTSLYAATSFIAFPFKFLLGLLIAIILAIAVIKKSKKTETI